MIKKRNFIKFIQLWVIIIIVMIGGSMIVLEIANSYRNFNFRADQMRSDYTSRQKQAIKQEVKRVVDRIRLKKAQSEGLTKNKVKSRVYEAYSIAQNIYQQNQMIETKDRIKQMILNALRPIRFENKNGYYFAVSMDGVEQLYPARPELEGKNLIGLQDIKGNFIIQNEINVIKKSGEGFVKGFRLKPGKDPAAAYKKISFVKYFKPLDWYFGTGLYVDDIENQIKADLLSDISRVRFGKEGYIFVNKLNGDTLVSNGKQFSGEKKLWEIFNENAEKIKGIFKKEHDAALTPGGDYIYYSWIKLTQSNIESPKVSFIYGIPELKWLVGAGVYLDDVETVIARMQTRLNNQIKMEILYSFLIILGIIAFLLLLFNWLNRKLKKDLNLFISFFNKAALSDESIDRDRVRFDEFDRMAENANKMLADRKQAEKDWQTTFNSTNDAIWIQDQECRILRCNKMTEKILQQPSDKIIGKHCWEVTHGTSHPISGCPFQRLQDSLQRETTELQIGKRFFQVTTDPILNETGGFDGAVHCIRDITERKRLEDARLESETKYRSMMEAMKEPVYICSSDYRVKYMNPAMIKRIGRDGAGELCFKVIHGLDEKCPWCVHDKVQQNESCELNIVSPKDNHSYHVSCSPIVHGDGSVSNMTICRDISELKKLEAQFYQAQKMESVGRLAGGVAHDYNNSLSVIMGFTELAMGKVGPDGPVRDNLEEILKAADRAAGITRQLLAFARKQTITPKVLDLNDSVESMLKMLLRLIGEDIDLTWLPGKNLEPVKMDPSQIDQILANLCINARDAISGVGRITIETKNIIFDTDYCSDHPGFIPGEFVMLAVSDNGCGMEKEIIDNIFEPFFTTKDVDKGTGLGLSTVYGIAKQNNGFVNVYSEPGKGTTIKIYLPGYKGEAVEKQEESYAQIPAGRGETLLVVEDDLAILNLVQKILTGLSYTVLAAGAPKDALNLAEKHTGNIHLVITDVVMPEMNGLELTQRLQSFYPDLKSIFMSGYTANVIAHHGILDKEVYFIQKPFSKRDLALTVQKALESED
ncbi:MAG: response regulator [Deltaproteobacteria bacterium]|nr:response regulator [Deltaproteobacteria bacterium]